jgi:hypothetical protein
MSIASELQRIIAAKTAIIQSIINKGVEVPEEAKIEDLADLIGQIGPGPTPTVNYVLLQNMIPEHSIGEPFDYADIYGSSWHDHWVDTVLYDDDEHEDYEKWDNYYDILKVAYKQNLLSTTVGAKTIDTRKPVDFSKYNITEGTPYGIFNGDYDYLNATLSFDLTETTFNPLNTTIETWAFCRSGIDVYESLMSIGASKERSSGSWIDGFQLNVVADNVDTGLTVAISHDGLAGDYMDLFGVYEINGNFLNSGKTFSDWVLDWHHYALGVDSNYIYFHIDGVLVGQKSLSDTIVFEYRTWNGSGWDSHTYEGTLEGFITMIHKWVEIGGANWNQASIDAGYAQLAVSDTCKWTSDFEVPTEAY